MTLEEAIMHAEEMADSCAVTDGNIKCETAYRHIAEWLKELLKERLNQRYGIGRRTDETRRSD